MLVIIKMVSDDNGYKESVDENTKFVICKECKYFLFSHHRNGSWSHDCTRLHKTKVICLVTGEKSTTNIHVDCKSDRNDISGCSIEGRYFEPKYTISGVRYTV